MHDYRHTAAPAEARRGPNWPGLAVGAAVALVLGAGSVVSLTYLAGRWEAEAPARAARMAAAEVRERELEAREAADKLQADLDGRNGEDAERDALARIARDPNMPQGALSPEQVREIAARGGVAQPRSRPAPVTEAARWLAEPDYVVRVRDLPPGESSAVDFRCRVTVEGRLTGCTATERPAGSGLARLTLPALEQARLEPMRVDGRAVESTVEFGVSFRAPPRRAPQAPEPAPANEPPVAAEAPAPPPSEPAPPPPPEPAPAG